MVSNKQNLQISLKQTLLGKIKITWWILSMIPFLPQTKNKNTKKKQKKKTVFDSKEFGAK